MGKLHTLRRAIERDPGRWTERSGAELRGGVWVPISNVANNRSPYRAFVRRVLRDVCPPRRRIRQL